MSSSLCSSQTASVRPMLSGSQDRGTQSPTNSYSSSSTSTAKNASSMEVISAPKRSLRNRTTRRVTAPPRIHKTRKELQEMVSPLKHWLYRNLNPYPTRAQKEELAREHGITVKQVSNWFSNARRRLKKAVKGEDLSWSTRIKKYNSCLENNAELMSNSSENSTLESDCEQNLDGDADMESEAPTVEENNTLMPIDAAEASPTAPTSIVYVPAINPNQANQPDLTQPQHQQPMMMIENVKTCNQNTSSGYATPGHVSPAFASSHKRSFYHFNRSNIQAVPTNQIRGRRPHHSGSSSGSSYMNMSGTFNDSTTPHSHVNKQSVLNRFLTDTNRYHMAYENTPSMNNDVATRDRHRNPSGSLCSENLSMSSRSSPTHEMEQDYGYENPGQWTRIARSERDLEHSAVLVLTRMAKNKTSYTARKNSMPN